MSTRVRRRHRREESVEERREQELVAWVFRLVDDGPKVLASLDPNSLRELRSEWRWMTGVLTDEQGGQSPTFEETLEALGLASGEVLKVGEAIRVSRIDFTKDPDRQHGPHAAAEPLEQPAQAPESPGGDPAIQALALMSGIPREAVERWRPGEVGSDANEQLLNEMHSIWLHLSEIISPHAIPRWLIEANAALGGVTPVEVLRRGDSERLRALIHHLEAGTPI